MELVYLMGSIAYYSMTSTICSFYLAFRIIISSSTSCFRAGSDGEVEENAAIRLYEGYVRHVRRRPVYHEFDYPVRYAVINLDRVEQSEQTRVDHLSATEARRITSTRGAVFLLTIPTSVGYDQNPLSVYYCFDQPEDGSGSKLIKCIAEVTNTPWGERVTFVFNPGSDSVAKPLHVSPFMDMLGNWHLHANAPNEKLFLSISVQHPTLGNYFTATLNAKRVSSSSSSSINTELFFWLMPQKVAVWIYWQAMKLWWKKVSFVQHPKFSCPTYRQDALDRNRVPNGDINDHGNAEEPRCVWREAGWPWV